MYLGIADIYTKSQHQRFDDACDIALIEKNGVPFSSDAIDFNESCIISFIAVLTLH